MEYPWLIRQAHLGKGATGSGIKGCGASWFSLGTTSKCSTFSTALTDSMLTWYVSDIVMKDTKKSAWKKDCQPHWGESWRVGPPLGVFLALLHGEVGGEGQQSTSGPTSRLTSFAPGSGIPSAHLTACLFQEPSQFIVKDPWLWDFRRRLSVCCPLPLKRELDNSLCDFQELH
jgi:hypothetical protein